MLSGWFPQVIALLWFVPTCTSDDMDGGDDDAVCAVAAAVIILSSKFKL